MKILFVSLLGFLLTATNLTGYEILKILITTINQTT